MTPRTLPAGSYFGRPTIVRVGPAVRIVITEYAPGERLPRHSHERPYLCVALAGRYDEDADSRTHEHARGGMALNPVGGSHSDRFRARSRCANIEFPEDWLDGPRSVSRAVMYSGVAPDSALLRRLERGVRATGALADLSLEETVARLLAATVRRAPRRRAAPPPWLATVLDLLRECAPGGAPGRAPAALSLGDAARIAGVHPGHLAREFLRHTGETLGDAARRARAEAAVRDLRQTDLPLATIAARRGFADQAHMTRSLRDYFGETPGGLRRESRRAPARM